MIKEMVCIVCPNGCNLKAEMLEDGTVNVTGATCKRGVAFATNELTNPMRSITSTVATVFPDYPLLPVKTDGEIPKDKIFEAMKTINNVKISKRLSAGDTVIDDLYGIKVTATGDMNPVEPERVNNN